MTDRTGTIDSPCVRTCRVDPQARLCIGCLRSLDEIAGWARMSPDERRAIMATLPSRAPLVAAGTRIEGREAGR